MRTGGHYLLFRCSVTDADDSQAYVDFASQGCALETLVAVASRRGCIEHAFEVAQQEMGLDDYEVRSAEGWYWHVTLALWALGWRSCGPPTWTGWSLPKKRPWPHSLAAFKRSRGLAAG